jgi:hypothetical protein
MPPAVIHGICSKLKNDEAQRRIRCAADCQGPSSRVSGSNVSSANINGANMNGANTNDEDNTKPLGACRGA